MDREFNQRVHGLTPSADVVNSRGLIRPGPTAKQRGARHFDPERRRCWVVRAARARTVDICSTRSDLDSTAG